MTPEYHSEGWVLPRIWPEPHPAADYTMGDAFLAWTDTPGCPGEPLTGWERHFAREVLCLIDGAPRYSLIVLRLARQQGKTYVLQRLLLWLLLHGQEWLGEPQRIVNTHFDGVQAVELMKPMANALGYGRGHGGKKLLESQVFMAQWYPGGVVSDHVPMWLSRAMTFNALTGLKGITAVLVDELQDAKRRQVQEGLGGAMSGARIRGRMRFYAGTGEKPGSDLLRALRASIGHEGVLWAEWSVPPGVDLDDESNWVWASPDWSASRLAYLREEKRMLPAEEFQRNYLLSDEAVEPDGLVSRAGWDALVFPPAGVWSAAGVEQDPGGQGLAVALAGDAAGGRVVVSVVRCGTTAEAVALVSRCGAGVVRVGKSLLADPMWQQVRGLESATGTGPVACSQLLRLIGDGLLVHDGGRVLGDQATGTTVVRSPGGLRITSRSGVDALKAAVWAVDAARDAPVPFRIRVKAGA